MLMFLCIFYVDYGYTWWRHQPVNMASRFLHRFRRSYFVWRKCWVPILVSKFSENCALSGKW